MRRVFAQMRKELTQIARDRLALVSGTDVAAVSDVAARQRDLAHSHRSADRRAGSRRHSGLARFLDAFRASLTFHIVSWPVRGQPADAFLTNTRASGAGHSRTFRPRHGARREHRGAAISWMPRTPTPRKLVQGYAGEVVYSNYRPAAPDGP